MKIFKYNFSIADSFEIELPISSKILAVQNQGNDNALWALVDDTETIKTNKTFRVFGTGQPLPVNVYQYEFIGTFQDLGGALVWHVFLRPEGEG